MRCVQSPSSGTTAGWGEVQTVLPVEQGAVCTSVVLCGGRPCEVLHVEKGYIAKTKACHMSEVSDHTRILCKQMVLLNVQACVYTLSASCVTLINQLKYKHMILQL